VFKLFEVELGGSAIKFLKQADKILQKRLLNKIDKLKKDPFPSEAVRVIGRIEKVFRVRVGDYRLMYVVD